MKQKEILLMSYYQGWIYSVKVKTQAVLPAQTTLRGKIFLSIYGENSSLNDAILGSGRLMQGLFHAGGEDNIELKSNKRLGEVKKTSFYFIEILYEILNRFIQLNYVLKLLNGNHGYVISLKLLI